MSDNAIDNITRAEAMGKEQYQTFVNHTSLRWINHSMNDNIRKKHSSII